MTKKWADCGCGHVLTVGESAKLDDAVDVRSSSCRKSGCSQNISLCREQLDSSSIQVKVPPSKADGPAYSLPLVLHMYMLDWGTAAPAKYIDDSMMATRSSAKRARVQLAICELEINPITLLWLSLISYCYLAQSSHPFIPTAGHNPSTLSPLERSASVAGHAGCKPHTSTGMARMGFFGPPLGVSNAR